MVLIERYKGRDGITEHRYNVANENYKQVLINRLLIISKLFIYSTGSVLSENEVIKAVNNGVLNIADKYLRNFTISDRTFKCRGCYEYELEG